MSFPSNKVHPTMFSLFPNALVIVLHHSFYFTNEELAALSLVNHECYRVVRPVLWTDPQLCNSSIYTPLQCFQALLSLFKAKAILPETTQMIHRLDISSVEETLYSTLPDDWLLILLSNTPNLHTLCLSGKKTGSSFVQSHAFRKLERAGLVHRGMENLDLSECTDIREPTLKSFVHLFPNLVSLNLSKTSGVTDTAVALIVDRCQYLKTINLSYCRQVTDLGLLSVAKFCRLNLRSLNLTGNLKITNTSLMVVAKNCPKIQKLFLGECSQVTDAAMEWIAQSNSSDSLKELELHRCDRVLFGLPLLELLARKCIVLERLTITYNQINSRRDDLKLVMEAFRDFHQLQIIDIFDVPEHSPALFFWDLAFKGSRGQLKVINLHRGMFVTDYILGNYAVAFEHDQNISDQTVRKFNDQRNGARKAIINLNMDDLY